VELAAAVELAAVELTELTAAVELAAVELTAAVAAGEVPPVTAEPNHHCLRACLDGRF